MTESLCTLGFAMPPLSCLLSGDTGTIHKDPNTWAFFQMSYYMLLPQIFLSYI